MCGRDESCCGDGNQYSIYVQVLIFLFARRTPTQFYSSSTMIRCINTVRKTKKSSAATTASSNLIVHNPRRLRRRKWNVKSNAATSRLPPIPQEPSKRELYIVALHRSIPFVGFGIMDNSVLILAGEAIDIELGTILNISTMCAAAIGNIIADLCGVAFGTVFATYLERLTRGRMQFPPMPRLTYAQRELPSVKMYGQVGVCAGLTLGCTIGMFPLLFFSSEKKEGVA